MCNSDKYLSVSATDILFVVTLKYYQAVKKRRKHYDNFLLCTLNWGNNISLMGSKAVQSFPFNVLFMWILGGEPGEQNRSMVKEIICSLLSTAFLPTSALISTGLCACFDTILKKPL